MHAYRLLAVSLLLLPTPRAQENPARHELVVSDLVAPGIQETWFGPPILWINRDDDAESPFSELTFLGDNSSFERTAGIDSKTLAQVFSVAISTEKDEVSCKVSRGRLAFVGDTQTLQRAKALLADLRGRLAAPISIEVALYRTKDIKSTGLQLLGAQEAEQRMDRFRRQSAPGLLMHKRASFRSGDRIYLGERRVRSYLADYNVEIAQSSMIADPVTRRFRHGRGMTFSAETRPDGRGLLLHFEMAMRSVPDRVGTIQVDTKHVSRMDRIEYETQRYMGSLALASKSAFVLAPGGRKDPSLRALVLVHHKVAPIPAQSRFTLLSHDNLTRGFSRLYGSERPSLLPDPLARQALKEDLLSAGRSPTGPSITIPVMDHVWLLVQADSEGLRRVLDRLDRLSTDRSRNYLVRLTREKQNEDGSWSLDGVPMALPVLAYRSAAAIIGHGQSYLESYNAAVAQKARILRPEVNYLFEGTIAHVSVLPIGKTIQVQLDLVTSHLDEMRRVASNGPNPGSIEAPLMRRIQFSRRLDLLPGQKQSLGDGLDTIIEGKHHRTRLSIQIDPIQSPR